jgi:broad specificity phosphatase PhoE
MHLYLIRHGQSYVNLPEFAGDNWDQGLTNLGQQQAARLATWMQAHVLADALYASTMRRAVETATYLADTTGLSITPDDRLREIGTCWADASPTPVDTDPPTYVDFWASQKPFAPIFEGGESWTDFVTRVGRFLSEITDRYGETQQRVLAVCHGGVINAAMDILFGTGPWRRAEMWVYNTAITHWEYDPTHGRRESWRLHGFNMAYHLLEDNGGFPKLT